MFPFQISKSEEVCKDGTHLVKTGNVSGKKNTSDTRYFVCNEKVANMLVGFTNRNDVIDAHIVTPRSFGFTENDEVTTEKFFSAAEANGFRSLPFWAGAAAAMVRINCHDINICCSIEGNKAVWDIFGGVLKYNDGCPINCCAWYVDTPILMMKCS